MIITPEIINTTAIIGTILFLIGIFGEMEEED